MTFTWRANPPDFRYPAPVLKTAESGATWYDTHTGVRAARVSTVVKGGKKFDPTNWRISCGGDERQKLNSEILLLSGTLMHSELEYYVKNNATLPDWIYWPIRALADSITPAIDQDVNNIRAAEQSLSNKAGDIAGTVDLVAEYRGKLSIIDYKTSYKVKTESGLKNYFLQASLYARLWEEMTGEHIEQIVILMVIVKGCNRIEYIRKTADYENLLDEALAKFKEGSQS